MMDWCRSLSTDGIHNTDKSDEATALAQRREAMQQASQNSSNKRALEPEIQRLVIKKQVTLSMTEHVRYLWGNFSRDESGEYVSVKAAVLTELKLSAGKYLQRFEGAVNRKEETWGQFVSHVKNLFLL